MDEEDDDEVDEDGRLQLPIASYFVLVVGYCAIGSLLFNTWERGAIWSVIFKRDLIFNRLKNIISFLDFLNILFFEFIELLILDFEITKCF